jgi:putative heme-binding domain-containing protein
VGEKGRELGPELTRIGSKQGRAKLLENILEPSKSIEPQYVTWVIETKAGKVISGLLVEKSTTHITVRDIEHKEHRLPLDETETVVAQQKSLMPELQLKDLTAEQVADLLAYLESLK